MSTFWSWNDFTAGWISGVLSMSFGYPMDTIKVRMQTQSNATVLVSRIVSNMFINEGIRGFYKGISYPVLSYGVTNSIYFGVYGNTLRLIESARGKEHRRYCCDQQQDLYKEWHRDCFTAGCVAGVFSSGFSIPIELVKTILQAHKEDKFRSDGLLTPTKCLKQLFKHKGFKGCFQGGHILLARDTPAYGIYALSYEHTLCILKNSSYGFNVPMVREGVAGGVAGVASWVVVLPVDVVKSRLMYDSRNIQKSYNGLRDCIFEIYKQHGIRGFFVGFWMTSIRAFPVSFICFVTYEKVLNLF